MWEKWKKDLNFVVVFGKFVLISLFFDHHPFDEIHHDLFLVASLLSLIINLSLGTLSSGLNFCLLPFTYIGNGVFDSWKKNHAADSQFCC